MDVKSSNAETVKLWLTRVPGTPDLGRIESTVLGLQVAAAAAEATKPSVEIELHTGYFVCVHTYTRRACHPFIQHAGLLDTDGGFAMEM